MNDTKIEAEGLICFHLLLVDVYVHYTCQREL